MTYRQQMESASILRKKAIILRETILGSKGKKSLSLGEVSIQSL